MEEFTDVMSDLTKRKAEAATQRTMMEQHEIWRQTTWPGYIVRKLQEIGDNAFINAIVEGLREQDDENIRFVLFKNLARVVVMSMAIAMVFAIGKVIQLIIGREVVVEQEIVILDEIPRSQIRKRTAKDKEVISPTKKLINSELQKKRGIKNNKKTV